MPTESLETTEDLTTSCLFVPEFRLEKLFHELEKLSRKAVRLGLEPITFHRTGNEELRDFTVTSIVDGPYDSQTVERKEKVLAVEVEVYGVSPTLAGWEFVATIDQVKEGVNILSKAPFSKRTIPARFEACTVECDHCKQDRNRKATFVLHNEADQEWMQVGRQCLRSFLGDKDPQALISAASIFETFATLMQDGGDFSGEACGKQEAAWGIQEIVEISLNVVEKYGWVSGAKAQDSNGELASTKERVLSVLFPPKSGEGLKLAQSMRDTTPELQARATAVIEFIRGSEDESEYLRNLRAAFTVDYCNAKRLGLVVSAQKAYQTHLERKAAAERDAALLATKKDEFFGTVGERVELSLHLLKQVDFDTQFGVSTLCIFEDAEGRAFKWFASNCPFSQEDTGKLHRVVATIKDQEIYRERKQTGLTRLKIWAPKVKKQKAVK